jgi:hypothetical protein
MRAKLGAKPFHPLQQHWTTMGKKYIAPAPQAHETACEQGGKSAIRGSNPLAPTMVKAGSSFMNRLPALFYGFHQEASKVLQPQKNSQGYLKVLKGRKVGHSLLE